VFYCKNSSRVKTVPGKIFSKCKLSQVTIVGMKAKWRFATLSRCYGLTQESILSFMCRERCPHAFNQVSDFFKKYLDILFPLDY